MNGYRAILVKEVIEAWRTYRIVVVCGLFSFLGVGIVLETRFLPTLTRLFGQLDPELVVGRTAVPDVVEAFVRALWLAGSLAGVLLAAGAVATERQRGTAAFVLSKPVSRTAFLWAKFVADALILGLGIALAALSVWLYVGLFFAPQPVDTWAELAVLAWLSSLAMVAITLAASTIARTASGATAIGLATIVALAAASSIVTLNRWLPTGLGEVGQALVLGEVGGDLDPGRTLAMTVGIGVVALTVAWLRLRRMDL